MFKNLSLYNMHGTKNIENVLKNHGNKIEHIPLVKKTIYAQCILNYDKNTKINSELVKIFNYHLTTWCNLQIKVLYEIHGNEKIPYNHPLLNNRVIASIVSEMFLINYENNLNNFTSGILVNEQLIPQHKQLTNIMPMMHLLQINHHINNTMWIIENYEITSNDEVICKLSKKL